VSIEKKTVKEEERKRKRRAQISAADHLVVVGDDKEQVMQRTVNYHVSGCNEKNMNLSL
jgi:hypothetical protein